jgi:ubiquinone/menaquinone biosynthesis C-methylase UbiE
VESAVAQGFFDKVFCCPHCWATLEPGASSSCERCGVSCRAEGGVLNFLGGEALRLNSRNDDAVVTWLLENQAAVIAAVGKVDASLHRSPDDYRAALAEIAAGTAGHAADLAQLTSNPHFTQIVHDIARMVGGSETSSDRLRFLLAEFQGGPESTVLDVGCSCGRHLWELNARQPILAAGVDVDLPALSIASHVWDAQGNAENARWCCASALSLPFRGECFSHIITFGILELLPVRPALAEMVRVLRPGGKMILSVEAPGMWRRYWDQAPPLSRRRLNLMRQWVGNKLTHFGINWQEGPLLRRLSRHTEFSPRAIGSLLERAGLLVERLQTVREYANRPCVTGIVARKPGG